MILVIILLVLLFGGGGGFIGYSRYGIAGGIGPIGVLLLIFAILWFMGLIPRGENMNERNTSTPKLILLAFSFVLFFLGAAMWWTAPESPHRLRIVSAGLACWVASTFF
jgi:hypothetical protein